ncbi:MAG: glycosyltransferase family 2 protein [Candidatus Thorarchaeota archaeon]|nr:glycosyltransferase family 2 protein [Candidatus Thorarchaeota archaeon]
MSKLIVAIPAFNEETVLPSVLKKLKLNLSDEEDSLILVVNDGSTDKTYEVAIKSGADIVVNHHQNLGVAQAYRTGIRTALAFGADVICTIDGDGQFDSNQIQDLVEPIKTGKADLVIGSRFIDPKIGKNVPKMNRLSNKLMAMLISLIIRRRIHDTETGFRAISRNAAVGLKLLGKVSFSNDMIIDVSKRNHKILEVPVKVKYFNERVSRVIKGFMKYGFCSICLILLKILTLRYSLDMLSNYYPKTEVITISRKAIDKIPKTSEYTTSSLFVMSSESEGAEVPD